MTLLAHAHALAAAGAPEAAAVYRQVLETAPDCADAANNLGVLLRRSGADAEAASRYRQALAAEPMHADASYNLGRVLLDHGTLPQAVAILRRAVALRPCAERLHTLGRALQAADALAEARAAYEAALRLDPGSLESLNNLANVLQALGQPQQAVALLNDAIAAQPDHAELRYNRSLALLLLGRAAEGWRDYEWRWRARGFPSPPRDFGLPRWTGATDPAATLLVHWEQGLGDTIQFARYVGLARARVGRLVLLVQRPLQRLLHGTAGADSVLAEGDALPRCGLQAPLLSLPHLLGGAAPPSPPAAVRPARSGPPQVGLVWAGNPAHSNDRHRSLPPQALAHILAVHNIAFRNLQLGPRRADIANSPDFAPADFAATADILSTLDLVIAVDTAVAHLAASRGLPVWLLLPFAPDWRWGASGPSTAWYPSMRLFRQRIAGRWQEPLDEISTALCDLTRR